MAKLEYDETGRLLFTQEMRKEYTILIPQMLPVHFGFFAKLLERTGYHVAILNNDGRSVVDRRLLSRIAGHRPDDRRHSERRL